MKKSREFDNVLDECLERLLVKGETIEQCLQSYPEQAAELKPLLQTALAAKEATAIQPRAEFRTEARYQFHSALQAMERDRRLPFFGRLPQWATVVAIVVVVLLAGSGTVAAASNSMPDNPLYSVKLATEQVQLILTPSEIGKAELYARLADERVAEIIYMATENNPEEVGLLAQRLNICLERIAVLAAADKGERAALTAPEQAGDGNGIQIQANRRAKLRVLVQDYAINHPAHLRAVLKTAPEQARSALRRAIATSEAGYEEALMALD